MGSSESLVGIIEFLAITYFSLIILGIGAMAVLPEVMDAVADFRRKRKNRAARDC